MKRHLEPVFDWIARLAGLNLLFCGVSLAGGFVLGVFPAGVALVSSLRSDAFSTRSFCSVAWRYRYRANLFGWVLTAVAVVMVLDIQLAPQPWIAVPACFVLLLVAIVGVEVPFVLLSQRLSFLGTLRFAAVSGLAHPVRSLGLLALFVGWSYVLGRWPALLPFFGLSPLAFLAVAWNRRPVRPLVVQESR